MCKPRMVHVPSPTNTLHCTDYHPCSAALRTGSSIIVLKYNNRVTSILCADEVYLYKPHHNRNYACRQRPRPHLHLWDSTTLAVDVPRAINKKADLKMETL